jgi:hypothetical protein
MIIQDDIENSQRPDIFRSSTAANDHPRVALTLQELAGEMNE